MQSSLTKELKSNLVAMILAARDADNIEDGSVESLLLCPSGIAFVVANILNIEDRTSPIIYELGQLLYEEADYQESLMQKKDRP